MNRNFPDFTGKVAIVTGAASGIGRQAAIDFAAAGASVIASDITETVNETVQTIVQAGGTAIALVGDAGREDDIREAVDLAATRFGGLDIFFANAGITGGRVSYADGTPENWLEVLRVNLVGPFLAVKHGAAAMRERGGGAIICTASVAGLRAGAGPAAYSASKAGVVNLVKTAALELSGSGIRINAICPGLVRTAMTQPVYALAKAMGHEDKIGLSAPSQRGGEPEDISAMVLFLASDAATFVNGQAIAVDGGLSALHPTSTRPAPVTPARSAA
ncbi:SDR family NAD(P)-dependent oxidoreductase [Sphingopyxis sp. R3-92]|uniref:SDR family NAD(P)-dependent oxidoreductase n=1 Tax=Sphingopyxis sp. R3-92 TaxID=3158553 RepID=UPI003EE6C6CE